MILDLVTVLFLLAGSLLLLRLVRQRPHTISTVMIESTHDAEKPATAAISSFGRSGPYSENPTPILDVSPGNNTSVVVRQEARSAPGESSPPFVETDTH